MGKERRFQAKGKVGVAISITSFSPEASSTFLGKGMEMKLNR